MGKGKREKKKNNALPVRRHWGIIPKQGDSKMTMRSLAAVAAMFGAVACNGADLGKYMLPDADVMLVTVGDSTKEGAFSKELGSSVSGLKVEDLLKGSVEKDIAKKSDVEGYALLVTGGVTRVETAISAKAVPGSNGEPEVDVSIAAAGFKNLDKLFKKLAADFPEDIKLEGGVLAPVKQDDVPVKAWVEDGVLRIAAGKKATTSKAAAASPFAADSVFGRLLAKASGNHSYAGLRIKDLVGVVKRFTPADKFEQMKKDDDVSSFLKLGSAGIDIIENETEPLLDIMVALSFDTEETATDIAEKVAGYKQLGLATIKESEDALDKESSEKLTKLLKGVKIATRGSELCVKISVDARDLGTSIKKAAESK